MHLGRTGGEMNKDQILEETLKKAFRDWWYEEGSGIIPLRGHDLEEHANRVAEIAWLKGAGIMALAVSSVLQLQRQKEAEK